MALALYIGGILLTIALYRYYHAFLVARTVMLDLPDLGKALRRHRKLQGRAVVLGGSICGLYAARVLSDHFEEVVILDDELGVCTDRSYKRANVMQWPYLHLVRFPSSLSRCGRRIVAQVTPLAVRISRILFPHFDEGIRQRDGRFSPIEQFTSYQFGQPITVRGDKIFDVVSISRAGFESSVRCLVQQMPSIRILHAKAIEPTEFDGIYTGVTYRSADTPAIQTIEAAFVADCTGVSRIGVKWQKRRFQAEVPPCRYYDTRSMMSHWKWKLSEAQWRSLPLPLPHDNMSWILAWAPAPNDPRGYIACARTEHNTVELNFTPVNGQPEVPSTCEELLSILQDRPLPAWFASEFLPALFKIPIIEKAQRPMPPYSLVYWDTVHVPDNFVALGDAVCRLNPTFAQGMSAAAMECCTLDAMLRRERREGRLCVSLGFGDETMKRVLSRVEWLHNGNKVIDYAWHGTIPAKGEELPLTRSFGARCVETIIRAAHNDGEVGHAIGTVISQFSTPLKILQPDLVARIVWQAIKRYLQVGMK